MAKSGPRWWVPAVEGAVALAIGVYIIIVPADAPIIVRYVLAVALLALSALHIFEGFRFWNRPVSPWSTLAGGVGATTAICTLVIERAQVIVAAPEISAVVSRQVLAGGLIAFGVIGLMSLIFTIRSTGFKIASLIIDVLMIVLGVFLFLANRQDLDRTRLLGGIAAIGGAVLLAYGYYLWRGSRPARPVRATPPPPPPPPPTTPPTSDSSLNG